MKPIDFTQGKNIKNIILFSLPILLGEILQQLYTTVDSMVVGTYSENGEAALAAVSICSVIINVLIALAVGFSVGAGVIVSKAFGVGNKEELRRKSNILLTSGVILGVILSVAGVALARPMLALADTRADYYEEALLYLRIVMAGAVAKLTYNITAGILRSIGDSPSTLRILAITGLLNVALDYIFVRYFGWGVAGVAIATFIAELLSAAMAIIKIRRYIDGFRFDLREMKRGMRVVKDAFAIGISVALQNAVLCFSNVFIYRYINVFDTAAVAGISAAQKLDTFSGLPANSIAATLSTAVAQNIGAGKYERIRPLIKDAFIVGIVSLALVSGTIYLMAPEIAYLFNENPDVIASCVAMVSTLSPFYILMTTRHLLAGALRAYGKTFWPAMSVIFGMVVVRQIFLAVMMQHPNINYIYACYPFGWFVSLFPIVIYYFIMKKKLRGLSKTAA